jgi:hypothetical protein
MKLEDQLMEEEVEAVMEQGRQIPPAPDVVRARLLARARAAFAASLASPSTIPALSTPTVWRGRRIAVAASVLLVFVAAAAGAAFHARIVSAPETAPPLVQDPPAARASAPSPPPVQPPEPVSSTRTKRPRRMITPQESYAAELQLLQRAQSEYAGHDFANALALLAEHGRRFPKGRLAEEREALRVRSLARAGRGDEARRALASFANRFPHSAFLPRLQAAAGSGEE